MTEDQRRLAIAGAVAGGVVLLLLFGPRVRRGIEPKLKAAFVAIEVEGSGIAEVGCVEVPSGTPFRLHAVLEAEALGGSTFYYTEAPRLRIGGGIVEGAALRPWDRADRAVLLWFSVEGVSPFLAAASAADLDRFRFVEVFRAEWPRTWSIPGDVTPSAEAFARGLDRRAPDQRFGTQRYHVRIELYRSAKGLTPDRRYASWGVVELPARAVEYPTVVAFLPDSLDAASRVFGLTQVEAAPDAPPELLDRVAEWNRLGLAFSRGAVVAATLVRAGVSARELRWRAIDLGEGPGWGPGGAQAGDLVRVGERTVVLFDDEGAAGRLDRDDLCFDYFQGAAVRPLGEVFVGDGLVLWASLK